MQGEHHELPSRERRFCHGDSHRLFSHAHSGLIFSQENPQSSKKGFLTVLPYYHSRIGSRIGCHPVEVRVASIGAIPPDVLTSQVVIESFSEKAVTGVKLRWDVYDRAVARKKTLSSCDAVPQPVDLYLSGPRRSFKSGILSMERFTTSPASRK